ncbi:anillin-like isoform X2 [Euwallacea fornicatus]|uniref:anillin-like isoform X2 n=1 Tax=Euwallacea fornicatus TaxID=995702 RepID=UPI0033903980
MDQIKLLVKDMLHKIQDIPDIPFTPIRMSDIASQPSLCISTSRSGSNNIVPFDHNAITPPLTPISLCNEPATSTPHKPDLSETLTIQKRLELFCNEFGGSQESNLSLKSSTQSECPAKPKILMGKRALLRSRSAETSCNDAAVVYDLVNVKNVNQKYQDKISHYITRIYHRRLSRESRSTDDATTSNSSLQGENIQFSDFPLQENLNFLRSTDDLNKNTTEEWLPDSAMSSTNDTSIEYDPEKFLKTAFGNITTDSSLADMSSSNTNLLARAGSFCCTVRKSFRRACSFREHLDDTKKQIKNRERCQSYSPDYSTSDENLMQELYVQNGIIFQVSKALVYCRNTKDLASPEYIEAEKILLVASCQKELIQTALNAPEYTDLFQTYSAVMEISNLVFYIKSDNYSDEREPNDFDEHFVIVVSSGRTVLASKVLQANINGEVKPDKPFKLTGLRNDSAVRVAVYSIRVKQGHEGVKTNKACPSPKGLFHLNRHHYKSQRKNLLVDNISTIKASSFNLCGSCTIDCGELQKGHFRMRNVPLSSSLEGFFTCSLKGNVILTNRTSDFLTIGFEDKGHLLWNRRWCVLDGAELKYWNYPSEEFCCSPIGNVSLKLALEPCRPADRSICPRSKSLSLLIKGKEEEEVVNYFLAFDSSEEKKRWLGDINFVIGTLSAWNCQGLDPEKRGDMVSSL